jgi:magnesium chelatase subunit I
LLPQVNRSACFYGCMPEDIITSGIDAVCPDCARKFGEGLPLTHTEPSRLVELPLNARLEDVVGGLDERTLIHEKMRLKRGLLAQADLNILYADEANLLSNEIVDAILDAAAQGSFTIRRGALSATYRSRFTLIGSMNPEEGNLRPQILDRFGLRVIVSGLEKPQERLLAYQRVKAYRENPRRLIAAFSSETALACEEIQTARDLLPSVQVPDPVAHRVIDLIQKMKIDSLRAEITLLEAARAFAASDGRTEVKLTDVSAVAPMALRLRQSPFMADYIHNRQCEEQEIVTTLKEINPDPEQ